MAKLSHIQTEAKKRLAVILSFSGQGGVEHMVMNLIAEFAQKDLQVDLVVIRAEGPHLDKVPDAVRLIPLRAQHTLTAIPELVSYMKREKPDAVLVAKDRAGRAALIARMLAGVQMNIWIRLGTHLSAALQHKPALVRWWRLAPMSWFYPKADGVIAVADGVREDTLKITGMASDKVRVIRNPVITSNIENLARVSAPHVWLEDKEIPVIMGVGRLSRQKDFVTLIKAFALVKQQWQQGKGSLRLIILGEGGDRDILEQLIESLDLCQDVLLPGFQLNPYSWISRADLFVLSSRWEGSPNVLAEALALGVPCVAADCPSGPNEILAAGQYGPLVPMGNVDAMAAAMIKTLGQPLPAETLQKAVAEYRADISAGYYLKALFPQCYTRVLES